MTHDPFEYAVRAQGSETSVPWEARSSIFLLLGPDLNGVASFLEDQADSLLGVFLLIEGQLHLAHPLVGIRGQLDTRELPFDTERGQLVRVLDDWEVLA